MTVYRIFNTNIKVFDKLIIKENTKGGKVVKIKLDLNEKYEDTEVLIKSPEMTDEVKMIVNFLEKKDVMEHFTGIKDDRFSIIKPSDIFRLWARKGKVFAETQDSVFEIKLRLYEVEERLSYLSFVRISKSEIINMDKIDYFESDFAGTLVIVLKNHNKSYVSRRYTKIIKERLGM